MQKTGYVDLHCDSLTVCFDKGAQMADFNGQINLKNLTASGCVLQCVAVFTKREKDEKKFFEYVKFFDQTLESCGELARKINSFSDVERARADGKVALMLTVENLAFLRGDVSRIYDLKKMGVNMASLTWNFQNALAYPCSNDQKTCLKRLKRSGLTAVEVMDDCKMIVDLSHLSSGGVDQILRGRKKPLVASHTACFSLCQNARNLTDGQIKKIADCGGVVGLCLYDKFLGDSDVFRGVYNHLKRLVDVGGEGVVALGTDFDGLPKESAYLSCKDVGALLNYLKNKGVSQRLIERFAYKNALRVIKDVLG